MIVNVDKYILNQYINLFLTNIYFLYLCKMARNSSPEKTYIESTRQNYQSRYKNFGTWAEADENAKPAERCRQLLLHFLSISLSKYNASSIEGKECIDILDAGCGSGRDLMAFGKCLLTVSRLKSNETGEITKCASRECNLGNRNEIEYYDEKERKHVPINASGFDVCEGFVEECRLKGLNAVQADFHTFFNKTVPCMDPIAGEKGQPRKYHAIFALASLFHLPKSELVTVLQLFRQHLHPNGILLTSIPTGSKDRMGSDGRWQLHLQTKDQIELLENSNFNVIHHENVGIYNGANWRVIISSAK